MHRGRTLTRWTFALASLLLLAGFATAAFAQTDVTTSRISGRVTDADGAALPGVTVEAKNQETGLQVVAVTTEDGRYRIFNLPTGSYSVTATLEGFGPANREIRLLIGEAPTLNFTLQPGTVTDSITVTSEAPVVEVTNTTHGTTIQTEQIKQIPINGREFRSLVLLTPETRLDSERKNLSLSGQRGINTNVTVDGVDYNNAFFGGTVGGAEGRAPLSISQESIKEFTVITNGASVEFGRSGGGFVNVITKNGTNNFRGSLFYYNQPQSLISNFANGVEPRDQKKEQYGASIGGPIAKDKLFFFASYDNQKQTVTVPIDPAVLNANIFAKYPALASPSTYASSQDGDVLFGRLDYQANAQHRFLVRGNFTKYDGVNGTSTSTTRTESYNGVEGLDTKGYVASWSGQFGANLLNDLNLNYVNEDTPREDKGLNLPDIQLGVLRYGEVAFLPIISTTKRKAFGDTVTLMHGDHVFKAGGEYNDTSIDQVFRGNWRGVYSFNNEADLLAGRWSQYRQFGGLGGRTSSQAGRASFGQKESALFLQDQWFLSSNLTLSAGIRAETQDNPNAKTLNPNDQNPNGSFRVSRSVPDSSLADQISPRIGLSWAPDSKTAVRFSAGRFWSRTPAILLAQLYTSNGIVGTQYIIAAPRNGTTILQPTDPLSPGWGTNFNPVGVEAIDFTRVPNPSRPGVFVIDSNFENPYTDRFTLGAEREILPLTSAGLDFTYAETKQLQRLKDINRQYDGTTAANGLPRYSSTAFPFPFYGRITTSVSDGTSKYTALTGTLRRRLANNFAYYAALTYSKDKDNDSNERNFAGIQAEDYNNLDLNYAYSNRDQRWKGVVNGLWQSPWWGISLSGAYRYSTGSPYNATVNADQNNDGESTTDRPTINGVHFDRNSFRQPASQILDLRVGKDFKVGPGSLSVFAECFNCTDAANRFVPNTVWGTGQTPNATFGKKTGVTDTPRTFQLAARYDF